MDSLAESLAEHMLHIAWDSHARIYWRSHIIWQHCAYGSEQLAHAVRCDDGDDHNNLLESMRFP
jgi:hypothetical protein